MLMISAREPIAVPIILQVILVYLHPFRRNSLFCSQKSPRAQASLNVEGPDLNC